MLKIDISKQAAKFLKIKRQPKLNVQLVTKIRELRDDPSPQDSKKLSGYPFKRVDTGEFRIVYEVKDETLYILIVGKRNDDEVYKTLDRKHRK